MNWARAAWLGSAHQRSLTSVTYIHKGDTWLSIADQGTLLP
jgi:hypothetical protein